MKSYTLYYPFIGLTGSILGLVCQGYWNFYRAQVFMATISILISLLIFAVFHGAMAKNRICRFLFFPLVIGISFFLSYVSVDRTLDPSITFTSEFGFTKPDSVQIENLKLVPIEFGYYTLMKMRVPQEVCLRIVTCSKNEEYPLVEQKNMFLDYDQQEMEMNQYRNQLPSWWKPAKLKNLAYFFGEKSEPGGDSPDYTDRILLWDKEYNLVYYACGKP